MLGLVTQWCPTLCPTGSSVHGDSPGKNTGAGCHALLQRIFLTRAWNTGLLLCRRILYCLCHQESPIKVLVGYIFRDEIKAHPYPTSITCWSVFWTRGNDSKAEVQWQGGLASPFLDNSLISNSFVLRNVHILVKRGRIEHHSSITVPPHPRPRWAVRPGSKQT